MSDMLAQAIVDASALKEAAVKNAENLVLEKYSNQIKDAVETLLEQDDPMGEAMPDPMAEAAPPAEGPAPMEEGEELEEAPVMEHIPLAVTSEDLDEEIEIPLEGLLEQITTLSETLRFGGDFVGDPEIQENVLVDVLQEDLDEMLSGSYNEDLDEDLYEDNVDEDLHEIVLDEEDFSGPELEEAIKMALAEELIVDLPGNNKSGWAGTPHAMVELAEEEILALEQDSEIRERNSAIRDAVQKLKNVNESLTKENTQYRTALKKSKKSTKRFEQAVMKLKEKLDEVNLTNAKLLYQNKALNSASLNERQKRKLVEAVSNADSVEEAKVIFETLESSVGSTSRKKQPNSLSEAVQKSSSMILTSRKENSRSQNSNPTLDRWKFLAGIDKK